MRANRSARHGVVGDIAIQIVDRLEPDARGIDVTRLHTDPRVAGPAERDPPVRAGKRPKRSHPSLDHDRQRRPRCGRVTGEGRPERVGVLTADRPDVFGEFAASIPASPNPSASVRTRTNFAASSNASPWPSSSAVIPPPDSCHPPTQRRPSHVSSRPYTTNSHRATARRFRSRISERASRNRSRATTCGGPARSS